MAAEVDPWKHEKAALRTKDAKAFVAAARFLSIQSRHPELLEAVRPHEARLLKVALERTMRPDVRIMAIELLATLESPKLAAISGVFGSAPVPVIEAAALALKASSGALVVSEPAVTRLLKLASGPDDSSAATALRVLGSFSDPRLVPALTEALEHDDPTVRSWAMTGLGIHRAGEATSAIVARLKTGEYQELAAASEALAAIATPAALAALKTPAVYQRVLKLTKEPVEGRSVIRALAHFQLPRVEDDLVALASRRDERDVIDAACAGLEQRGAEGALAELTRRALAKGDPGYYCTPVVRLMIALGAKLEKPDAKAVKSLGAAISGAKLAALEEAFEPDAQFVRGLRRALTPKQTKRLGAWVRAVASQVKDPEKRRLFTAGLGA